MRGQQLSKQRSLTCSHFKQLIRPPLSFHVSDCGIAPCGSRNDSPEHAVSIGTAIASIGSEPHLGSPGHTAWPGAPTSRQRVRRVTRLWFPEVFVNLRDLRLEELNNLRLAIATFALHLDAFEARLRGGPVTAKYQAGRNSTERHRFSDEDRVSAMRTPSADHKSPHI
jgi:hypothetical protein